MPKHICINGTPWCDAQVRPSLFGLGDDDIDGLIEAREELQAAAKERGMFIICQNSKPNIDAAAAFLRERGLPAEVVEGACPMLRD